MEKQPLDTTHYPFGENFVDLLRASRQSRTIAVTPTGVADTTL